MKFGTTLFAMLLAVGAATGCDPSKAELDKTKQELTTVMAERDNLKSQLDLANTRATQLQQQITDLQAKAAAVPPPAEPVAAEPEKKTAKKPASKAAAQPAGVPVAPKANETELKANKQERKGMDRY